MSAYRAPKIVTDQLVFCIDAMNPKSYKNGSWDIQNLVADNSTSFQEYSPQWDGQSWQILGDAVGGENYASLIRDTIPELHFNEGDYSVEIWCKYKEFANYHTTAVSVWNTGAILGTNEWVIGAHPSTHYHRFLIADATNANHNAWSDTTAELNKWYHLVGVRSGATASLYEDCVMASIPVSASALSESVDTDTAFYIGAIMDGQGVPYGRGQSTFSGSIGVVKIYKKALSANEVKQNYNALKSRYE